MTKHLPNAITCLNLFSGCLGIVFAFRGDLDYASYAIVVSAVFDFFDGMVARLLKAYSDIGKDLDSLADMVSFGVLPSLIIYQLFLRSGASAGISEWLSYSSFLIAIFSALRLAKFNNDTRQAENFIGLPTPANAMLIASLPFIIDQDLFISPYLVDPAFLVILSIAMSFLLISEIPLISLKFSTMNLKANVNRYILVFSSLILLLIFKFAAVPLIVILYLLISFIQFRTTK